MRVHDIINEDWQKANKSDKTAGMSQKAVNAYRRENPGSKLKTAVTKDPSKLKSGSKDSKRRKSFCARSNGQKKMHNIDCSKTPDKAICAARRRWNCEEDIEQLEQALAEATFGTEPKRPAREGSRPARGHGSAPRYKSAPVVPGGDNPDAPHAAAKGDTPVQRGDAVLVQDPDNIATVLSGTVKRIGREFVYVTLKNGETIAAPHDEVSTSYEVLSKRAHNILNKKGPSRSKYKVDETEVDEIAQIEMDPEKTWDRLVRINAGTSKNSRRGEVIGKIGQYPVVKEGSSYVRFYVVRPDKDQTTDIVVQGTLTGNNFREEMLAAAPGNQVKAVELYKFLVMQGYNIISDKEHTPGAMSVWSQLAATPGISVKQYSKQGNTSLTSLDAAYKKKPTRIIATRNQDVAETKKLTSREKFVKGLKRGGYDVEERSKFWDEKVKEIETQIAAHDEEMRQRKQGQQSVDEECAGVGIVTKQNSTADVGPGTTKKNLKAFNLAQESHDDDDYVQQLTSEFVRRAKLGRHYTSPETILGLLDRFFKKFGISDNYFDDVYHRAVRTTDHEAGILEMQTELDEWKASRKLCRSSTPDSELGASALASCKSQGLRARDGNKSHKLGKSPKSRMKMGGHRIKGKKYGGPLPDWSEE